MAGAVDEGEVDLLYIQFAEVLFDVVEGYHRIRRTVRGIAEPWRRRRRRRRQKEAEGGRRRQKQTEEEADGGRRRQSLKKMG